jgi:hypothetical protein
MQKLINLLALASFGVSAAVVGGGAYLYLNKDTLIEDAREKVTKEITKTITEALPGMISGAMPEMPKMTGGALPTGPKTTGPAIPF